MNYWMTLSIDYANQKSYLDDLFQVYPTIPEGIREVNKKLWGNIEKAFSKKDNSMLLGNLLSLDLFPIKDSYVAYLRRDKSSINRNPATVDRLCGRIYEMGLDAVFNKCSEPKETNRQIGPLFKRWLNKKSLGVLPLRQNDFLNSKDNAMLEGSDLELKTFAHQYLNYNGDKGLDFIGRFNGKYVIGEAKFLTDFGGHQNAQFSDAISTLKSKDVKAIIIAILDGVLYIKGNNKMYRTITTELKELNIMSSLVLRDFLYQV